MPRSRSWSIESITRSDTSSCAANTPDWRSIASTSVVLPWSTCAMIATLRMSERRGTRPPTLVTRRLRSLARRLRTLARRLRSRLGRSRLGGRGRRSRFAWRQAGRGRSRLGGPGLVELALGVPDSHGPDQEQQDEDDRPAGGPLDSRDLLGPRDPVAGPPEGDERRDDDERAEREGQHRVAGALPEIHVAGTAEVAHLPVDEVPPEDVVDGDRDDAEAHDAERVPQLRPGAGPCDCHFLGHRPSSRRLRSERS